MGQIFAGLLFVLVNFNITTGESSFDLFPNFIGYIFILAGLLQIQHQSEQFKKAVMPSGFMIFYSAIIFFIDLAGFFSNESFLSMLAGLFSLAFCLWITYLIVFGIIDMEKKSGINLESDTLYLRWRILFRVQCASTLLFWFPLVNIVLIIFALAYSIYFLVAFSHTRNHYREISW